mgnify:CR=1 FL=1
MPNLVEQNKRINPLYRFQMQIGCLMIIFLVYIMTQNGRELSTMLVTNSLMINKTIPRSEYGDQVHKQFEVPFVFD